jgi:hypothetical protein
LNNWSSTTDINIFGINLVRIKEVKVLKDKLLGRMDGEAWAEVVVELFGILGR